MSVVKRRIAYIYPYTERNVGIVSRVNPRYDISPADDYVVGQVKQYLDSRVDESKYIVVLADFLWRRGRKGTFGDLPISSDSYVSDENGVVEFEKGFSEVPILYLSTNTADIATIIHENHHMMERFGLIGNQENVPSRRGSETYSILLDDNDIFNANMKILFREIRARISELRTIYHGKGRLGKREEDRGVSLYAHELYRFLYGYFSEDYHAADEMNSICNYVFVFLDRYLNGEFSLSDREKAWMMNKLTIAQGRNFEIPDEEKERWKEWYAVADLEPDMSYLDWHGKRKNEKTKDSY